MGLSLGNLNTRLQFIIQDKGSASSLDTDRVNALADADVELSSIKGFWHVRSHDYTTTSAPAASANRQTLAVPPSLAFEEPSVLYYRQNGAPRIVRFLGHRAWLLRSNTAAAQASYPRWAKVVQTASAKVLHLDRPLSSDFVSQIGTLTLDYFIEITRLSAPGDASLLPDSLRHHIVAYAALLWGLAQGDQLLVANMKVEAERAREAVLRYDIEHTSEPRQIRPMGGYEPQDAAEAVDEDY